MKNHPLIRVILTGIAALAASSTWADTLVLRSGETLSGELLDISDGTLTFVTTLSGQMMVPTEEVESIATGSYMRVSLAEGPPMAGRFVVSGGTTRIRRKDGTLTNSLNLASVTSATPLTNEDELHLTWETGIHWRSGNTDNSDLFARLALTRQTDDYAFRSLFFIERADPERFPRWFRADTEWRLGPRGGFYPVAAVEIERDTDAALSLRGNLSLGVGKDLFAGTTHQLEADVGVGGTAEYFDTELLEKSQTNGLGKPFRRRDSTRDEQELHLRLRLRYARTLFKNGAFEKDLKLYPSLTGLGELRARSESSLLFPFTQRFKLKLDLLVDYESSSEFHGLDHWRTSVGASFLWDF